MSQVIKEDEYSPLVLVIDDEASIREALCGVLEDENFRTITADKGEAGIEQIKKYNPEIIFLDIWLPGWDGIETLERIKAISSDSEIIMMSGHATISNALEATKRGAFDFIEKPLDLEAIVFCAKRAYEKFELSVSSANSSGKLSSKDQKFDSNFSSLLNHPGILSTGYKGENYQQRTLATSTLLYGQGLHSGDKSGLVLEPLPKNSGIHFARIGDSRSTPSYVDFVESTGFATTIRSGEASASTVEHLLSALHAYKISNLLIKCNGEVPIFDGSALEFCRTIEKAGIQEQGGDWFEIAPDKEISFVSDDGKESIKLEPSAALEIDYTLSYPEPVGEQHYYYKHKDAETFLSQIAPARTFGFMKDIEKLQKAGLAAGGRLDNFILIGEKQVINTELRFENELCRHKILDILGDLFLLGRPLRAKITAKMTGHFDNIAVLRKIREGAVT